MVDLKKKGRKGSGRVAFLAHLEGIKKMIDAGHLVITVFEEYENKVGIKSGQFGKYVRRYVKGDVRNKTKQARTESRAKGKEMSTLDNLKSTPNQEDII
jgi:topoisomerase IA-like protein